MAFEKLTPPELRKHESVPDGKQPGGPSSRDKHRVVIVGGGFGGLYAARELEHAEDIEVVLIDSKNYHLFIPLLYQVATGALSPANISAPFRTIFRRRPNVRVMLGEVTDIDPENKRVELRGGQVEYDTLVLAAGAPRHHYFGNKQWAEYAPGLKSIEDATDIRSRILMAFEAADREPDPVRRRILQTFVVIGAGPTGVELSGAIAEIANTTLPGEFTTIKPEETRVYLLEGMDQVLPAWDKGLAKKTKKYLERLGVSVRNGAMVEDVQEEKVVMDIDGTKRQIEAGTILWAGGVQANPLGETLCDRLGCEMDKLSRIHVDAFLNIPESEDIHVIGDMANVTGENGDPLPGLAAVAMQQGKYVATHIQNRLHGDMTSPFRYKDRGIMATIGRKAAVADFGKIKLTGLPGWLFWLFVHLMYVVLFQNRALVFIQWAWNYITKNRSSRLITHRTVEEILHEADQNPVFLKKQA